jgi:hypothetical protein
MATDVIADSLKIGDLITFKSVKWEQFLSCDGILFEDMSVSGDIRIFEDSLFAVHLQRQYSAARELVEFLAIYGSNIKNHEDQSLIKYYKALQRGRENENKLNDLYMESNHGKDVVFGDIIQLYHLKSKKYLTVCPGKLANCERENLRVMLQPNGNTFSWIQISPRFKIDREGDPIKSLAEVFLKASERTSEYVHCADRKPLPGKNREVNCSLVETAWQISIFQNSTDVNPNILSSSDLVYINDPETRCNLTIYKPDMESLVGDGDTNEEQDEQEEQSENSDANSQNEAGEVVNEEVEYYHEFGDIVLQPIEKDISGSLWYIESDSLSEGGPIKWKTNQVRFKHLITGKYLCSKVITEANELGMTPDKIIITAKDNCIDPGTLFNLNELHNITNKLSNSKALQLYQGPFWMERGEVLDDMSYQLKGCKDKSLAVNLIVNRFANSVELNHDANDEDKTVNEPLDEYVGVRIRDYLQQYLSITVVPSSDIISSIWVGLDKDDIDFFHLVMEKAVYFSQGFSISSIDLDLDVEKSDAALRRRRQNLLRETGIIEVVLRSIQILIDVSKRALIMTATKPGKKGSKIAEEAQIMVRMGQAVLKRNFTLLFYCVQDNADNQMYVADHMPLLLAHLEGEPLAGKCVTEMLSNNMELQETKIGTREIAIFVEKLRSSKMNSMYLQLLQSCCSCQGSGVDGNQCKVSDLLFENTNDIIIHLHPDYAKLTSAEWKQGGLYIPEGVIAGSPIRGDTLLYNGLPQLALSWTTNSIDFSPLGLFGKLSVNVEELYKPSKGNAVIQRQGGTSSNAKKLAQKKNASFEQKLAVAQYFISEMYLGAEMCMDRNYVAMHKLDFMFPYEVLITILKIDVELTLKSAAVRLLMCLHVDRDPQAQTKIPCLTRAWSDIQRFETPQLPYVEANRRNMYCLLQQILSEHIEEMAGNRWTQYSQNMLCMLHAMVRFNFYGTTERLKDVIDPIITALDRRLVVYSSIDSEGDKKSSKTKSKEDDGDIKYDLNFGDDEEKKENEEEENWDEDDKERETIEPHVPWQNRVLVIMEGMPMMLAVLSLVFIAVCLTVWQSITNVSDEPGTWLYNVGLVILFIFIVECSLRGYCAVYVRGSLYAFVSQFFNQIDFLVIFIDIVFLCLPTGGTGPEAKYSKTLRLVRMVRLLRVFRAARVVSAFVDYVKVISDTWKMPIRYSKVPNYELYTMVEALDILLFAQNVIEDRNLSLLLRKFYQWEDNPEESEPADLFEEVCEQSTQLSLGSSESFNLVFLDLIMFVHTPLVQGALDVMMAHHSMRRTLLDNAVQVQLLASVRRERQYKVVDQMLQQLERNAETHELWGELQCESDYFTSKQTKDILIELTDICRIRRSVLEFDSEYEPDSEIQNLFRNLGCFNIMFKVLDLLDSAEEHRDEETEEFDEVGKNTTELCLLLNGLMFWFIIGNSINQELAYEELDFFLDSLDKNIMSHHILTAIFEGNEKLMKLVPHSNLNDMAEKICKDGKLPQYLYLSQCITNVGDKNIVDNQFQIMKSLASPGVLQKVASFFCPVDSPEYELKREMMAPFLKQKEVKLDELPELLAYHLLFVDVMSSCTVGRLNITSVEAKVQSVYNYIDIINSILDPGTITFAKIRMGRFLFNAVIEVEMMIPGLEHMSCIWEYFSGFHLVFKSATEELQKLAKGGWGAADLCKHNIEYMIVCAQMVGGFFGRYFDPATFRLDEKAVASPDYLQLSMEQVNKIIVKLFFAIRKTYELHSEFLSPAHILIICDAMEALNKSSSRIIASDIEKEIVLPSTSEVNVEETETTEVRVLTKYSEFLEILENNEDIQSSADNESIEFVTVLESLPFIADNLDSDLRYEGLIKKLVSHIRENIRIENGEKRMDARCVKTTTWILKAFRTMIENKMGMSIFERDEDGGDEEDEAAAPVVNALNVCGATLLCLDLIAVGMDETLQAEAMKLCVGLLFKEGGALEVQILMWNYLSKINSELFFKQIRAILQKLIAWHRWNDVLIVPEDDDPSLPDEIIVVRFLQLMCEGHYLPNQDIMREQPNNPHSYNLLDDLVVYLNCLTRIPCRTSSTAGIRVSATILEVIQGPCGGNQRHFALATELLETLNRLLRQKLTQDCVFEEELELKKTAIEIFQGLLEAQGLKSIVYERLLSVIHLDVIQVLSGHFTKESLKESNKSESFGQIISDDEVALQTECVVLLQMLCDHKPSIRDELGIPSDLSALAESGTASIEVVWNGVIQRRFFHVPDICGDLAKSSKDNVVENVDRTNPENKLIDFVARAHQLYREIKHQQVLKEHNISGIFSRQNSDRATNISFLLAVVINILYVTYYSYRTGEPIIPDNIIFVIDILNVVQIAISCFTLLLCFVLRIPVKYQELEAAGYSGLSIIISTASEPLTLYYIWYLSFCILGYIFGSSYTPFLLLDIVVKNATTRDVLNAVVAPRVQLMWTLILMVFVIYILSFFMFIFIPFEWIDDVEGYEYEFCGTLFNCLKTSVGYGLRAGGGIADYMMPNIMTNLVYQMTFFLIVMIVMLNVVFGIIIDTFGSLRAQKMERLADTVGLCFICAIDEQTFDRASDAPAGFKRHVAYEHNMWNYLYFIIHLWEQDKDDDDGLEQFVRRSVDAAEIVFFPTNKAMCLDLSVTPDEALHEELNVKFSGAESNLSVKLDSLHHDITKILDGLTKTLMSVEGGNIVPYNQIEAQDSQIRESKAEEVSLSESVKWATNRKDVSAKVTSLTNFVIPKKDDQTVVQIRIISLTGFIYVVNSSLIGDNYVYFEDGNLSNICNKVKKPDDRSIIFQVMFTNKSLINDPSTLSAKIIGNVEISINELISEENHVIKKPFTRVDIGGESILEIDCTSKNCGTIDLDDEELTDED